MGYARKYSPDAPLWEADTHTCPHCGGVWLTKSSTKEDAEKGGYCRNCDDAICPRCDGKPCYPHMRRVEAMEHRARLGTT